MDKESVDKPIKATGSRTRLNIVGAIRLGHLEVAVIEQYDKIVNGELIVDFLTKPRDAYHATGTFTCYWIVPSTIVHIW
jgi:hypothetical protein